MAREVSVLLSKCQLWVTKNNKKMQRGLTLRLQLKNYKERKEIPFDKMNIDKYLVHCGRRRTKPLGEKEKGRKSECLR